jgi:hypothetical protein
MSQVDEHASLLVRIDRKVVPALERGRRGLARLLTAPFRLPSRLEDRFAPRLVHNAIDRASLLVLLAVAIGTAGAGLHMQRALEVQRGADPSGPVDVAAVVGPEQGERVRPYARERRDALGVADPSQTRLAVVSFGGYRGPEQVAGVIPGTIHELQVKLPDALAIPQRAEVSGGDTSAAAAPVIERELGPIEDELTDAQALLDSETLTDDRFEQDLRDRVAELTALRDELTSDDPRVVFAVVVEAEVAELQTLAARRGVRLVDLAPAEAAVDASLFYGLLPDDRRRVTAGHDPAA